MDPRDVNSVLDDLEPAARPVVHGYLRELSAALPVSRRVRAAILAEVADGLVEEVNATRVRDPAAAARAALLAFGNPRDLAVQFARSSPESPPTARVSDWSARAPWSAASG